MSKCPPPTPLPPDRRLAFSEFEGPAAPLGALRARVRAAHRRSESQCVASLMAEVHQSPSEDAAATHLAGRLVAALREKGARGPVEQLMREFSLSSAEGVCPDVPRRSTSCAFSGYGEPRRPHPRQDRTWRLAVASRPSHLAVRRCQPRGASRWTGRVVGVEDEAGLTTALTGVLRRAGQPAIRMGVDLAMRMLGGQFVTGRSIAEALRQQPAEGGERLPLFL